MNIIAGGENFDKAVLSFPDGSCGESIFVGQCARQPEQERIPDGIPSEERERVAAYNLSTHVDIKYLSYCDGSVVYHYS